MLRCHRRQQETADEADQLGSRGFRSVQQDHQTGGISGRDGSGGAVVAVVCAGRAALPQGRAWAPPGGPGAHAAHPFSSTLVQPERSGRGGGAVRVQLHARVCGHRPGPRARARRDHGVQVPPPAGAPRVGPPDLRAGGPAPAGAGLPAEHRDDRGRHAHRCAQFHPQCPKGARPRDGSSPGRATSGISA